MAMVPRMRASERQVASSSSTSQAIQGSARVDFGRDFRGSATLTNGTRVLAEYKINEPTGAPAYFFMLLDASGSMFLRQAGRNGGRRRHVYEHLFDCYEDLVTSGKALRPDDIVCVFLFNKRTKLLCEVEARSFHGKKEQIRREYEKELDNESHRGETRLYDAVVHVMDTKIRAAWRGNKKADFFLVTFTDGRDSGKGRMTLVAMMQNLVELSGRLHTYFITVNLPTTAALYLRLMQQTEMKLVRCESTQPSEISSAFNTVREHIKAVLVLATMALGDVAPKKTRIVGYGKTKEEIVDQIMDSLAKEMRSSSLIEACHNMKLTHS